MKRFRLTMIPCLVAFSLLTGCGNTDDKQLTVKQPPAASTDAGATPPTPTTTEPEADVAKQFEVLLSQAKEARELIAFLDQHIATVDTQTADQLFLGVEGFHEEHLQTVNDNFRALLAQPGTAEKLYALDYPYDFTKIQNDDNLKQWLLDQTAGKWKLTATFDMELSWEIDYDALQAYAPHLSPDLKEYLSIRDVEAKNSYLGDGGLSITREELGERMIKAENHLAHYPDSSRHTQLKRLYKDYLQTYLSDYRYEAVDERTMKLLPAVKTSCQSFVKKYPKSKTSQIVSAYLTEIQKNNDVIYHAGKQGESIFGEPMPNLSQFWEAINERIDAVFSPAS